jgi:hypothetical protein
MDRRRLIFYLLLNIFVSACVTSGILYWYDRNYRAVSLPQFVPAPASAVGANATPAQTLQAGLVQIVSIVGAGSLAAETVTIQYKGEGELDLSSWQLRDASGDSFTFPPFKLFKNGAVRVHTTNGTNTAIDLYWGQSRAIWQSGVAVQLMNPEGGVMDSYPVP